MKAVLNKLWYWMCRILLVLIWVWAFFVIWFYDPLPTWLCMAVAIMWAAALPIGWAFISGFRKTAAGGALTLVFLLWIVKSPSNDRDWVAEQERLITAEFDRGKVIVKNLRHMSVDSEGEYLIDWNEKILDLEAIRSVDFVIVPIATWNGIAHTFVTFGFSDGEYVSISVESRKEKNESFSAFKGLFKKYEIAYHIGDERDFVGIRANVQQFPVYVLPIKAPPERVRALFVSMLERANSLSGRPEFYNTFSKNCTTSIVRHLEDLSGKRQSFDLRILFPGFAADLAYELGLIDVGGVHPSTWERFRIKDDVPLNMDGAEWSRAVRGRSVSGRGVDSLKSP